MDQGAVEPDFSEKPLCSCQEAISRMVMEKSGEGCLIEGCHQYTE